jgi:protein-L-isoaspartate(D-aspartate) O-methyltransferase
VGKPIVLLLLAGLLLAGGVFTMLRRSGRLGNQNDDDATAARQETPPDPDTGAKSGDEDSRIAELRRRMVDEQMRSRDITDQRVLEALERVPRHRFVPSGLQQAAYEDSPLPIGHGQTISQPYIVALMTQLVGARRESRALDIGTGSGYQAAVLAELVGQVYSIEIVEPLADEAKRRLDELGYKNIQIRAGDGYRGWPEHAPFDVIIVAAAPDHVPQPLIDQLAVGGKMVIPIGTGYQNLLLIEKQQDGSVTRTNVAPVAFVPMTGEAENGD